MFQQIIDFITSQSMQSRNLSLSTRIFRNFLLLVILAIPTFLCGVLVSFKVAFQLWLLLLAALVPLVGGFFLIRKYQWNNQKIAFLLATGLLGFVAFELSVLGMLIDERSNNFSLTYILSNAVLIGAVTFVVSTAGSVLFTMLFRSTKGKK